MTCKRHPISITIKINFLNLSSTKSDLSMKGGILLLTVLFTGFLLLIRESTSRNSHRFCLGTCSLLPSMKKNERTLCAANVRSWLWFFYCFWFSVCPPTFRLPLFRSPFVITAAASNNTQRRKWKKKKMLRMREGWIGHIQLSTIRQIFNLFLVSFSRKRREQTKSKTENGRDERTATQPRGRAKKENKSILIGHQRLLIAYLSSLCRLTSSSFSLLYCLKFQLSWW